MSRNMPNMLSSAADFRIVSPNARSPMLYLANLNILATLASLITRITTIAPKKLALTCRIVTLAFFEPWNLRLQAQNFLAHLEHL